MEILGVKIEELRFDSMGSWPLSARNVVCSVVSILTLTLGYFVQISEKMNMLDASTKRVVSLSATFLDTHRKVSNLEAYRIEVDDVKKKLEELTSLLPPSSEMAEVLGELSKEAVNNGLDFIGVKPGSPATKLFYNIDPIDFTLAGNYLGLGQFVSNIASMPRIVTLHDFIIQNNKNGSGLTMSVTAKTYWASLAGRGG